MKKRLELTVANPAGNITILVKTRCDRSEYQKIGSQLLSMKELGGEAQTCSVPCSSCRT